MKAQDCLNLLREMRDVAFATVDRDGKPRNRIIDVMFVEENHLYFCTARGKDFYQELITHPDVAITGLNSDWQTVRLTGKARRITENANQWIDRIFEENPSMNGVYPGDSRYILDPFVIEAGELELFDLSSHPIHRESFVFGQEGTAPLHGFFITDTCIECGTCQRGCPQGCIKSGTPFKIQQEACLHCGLCFENCPVSCIVRRGETAE
jgi:uncharacterized pyridoxamine 5'-phosphate oxidase family protein/Pyruvate/2-oxoacid:ferredoxin oxidoreductase delta subunit